MILVQSNPVLMAIVPQQTTTPSLASVFRVSWVRDVRATSAPVVHALKMQPVSAILQALSAFVRKASPAVLAQ